MASGLILLDTNILVHLIRESDVGQRVNSEHGLDKRRERPLISAVTVGEMYSLAAQFHWGEGKKDRIKKLLSELVHVQINQGRISERYAEIDYYSRYELKPSRNSGQNDLWIAATASETGAELFTTDTDFDHLGGVYVNLVYVDPRTGSSSRTSLQQGDG